MKVGLVVLAALGGWACTSVATAPDAVEQRVPSSDGVPIAWEERGAGEPTIFLVHGWCGDRALWRTTADALAPTHRVVTLDLAGHGSSGRARARWSLDSLADDIVAVVTASGAQDVILVGHSMGGPVALLAAPRLAPRVRGVIGVESLHDARFRYPPGFLEAVADGLEQDFPRALEASLRGTAASDLPPERFAWLRERALRTDRGAAIGLLRGLGDFDLGAALAGAGVPVRVINSAPHGTGAVATATDENRLLADFEAVEIDDPGHFPMLERPARFLPLLERWIDELSSTNPATPPSLP